MTRRARLEQALVDAALIVILVGVESLIGLATWATAGVIAHTPTPGPLRDLVLLVAALFALPCLWVYAYGHLLVEAEIVIAVPAPPPATRPRSATYHGMRGRHQTDRRPAPKGGTPT